MKNNLSTIFSKVPSKSEVKMNFNSNNNYNNKLLNYLKSECYTICSSNYLDKRTINNIFEYLYKSINVKKLPEAKRIIELLIESMSMLNETLNNNEQSIESTQSINHIKNNINIFMVKIADEHNYDAKDFIRMVSFEKLMKELFVKKNSEIFSSIENKIKVLNYHDFNNNTLDDLLYSEINKVIDSNNNDSISYITNLTKLLLLLPGVNLDKDKYYKLLINLEFGKKDNTEISHLCEKVNSLEYKTKSKRYSLIDDFVFSIDSYETKKMDDAFSIEKYDDGYLVGIHIADVVSLGFDDKFLFENEEYNSSSGYSAASLVEGNIKNANSLFIEIGKDGEIKDYIFLPTKINLNCNTTKEDIENLLLHKEAGESIKKLDKESRDKLLESVFNLVNLYYLIENQELVQYIDVHNASNNIVEKFMILYNSILSSYFSEKGYPFIYLNGDKYSSEFSVENKGYNTGFSNYNSYGRATSPIIDRASSISQVLLSKCYYEKPSEETIAEYKDKLKVLVKKLNSNRQ